MSPEEKARIIPVEPVMVLANVATGLFLGALLAGLYTGRKLAKKGERE